jgi:hypothetical protein
MSGCEIHTASALPIEQYHNSAPQWLSKTSLRAYRENGPAWWHRRYVLGDRTIDRTPGGAAQGSALDAYLTGGDAEFARLFAIKPDKMSLATKEGKAWAADQGEREIISHQDGLILADAVAAVRSLPCYEQIMRALPQTTLRRHSPGLGLGLQSRPDWHDHERGIVWDLKKTRDLTRFGRQAIDLGYHLQAAVAGWCLAGGGVAMEHAYLIAVEWEPCARARVFEIPHEALSYGDRQMRETAAEIASRLAARDWSDIQPEPEPLGIPDWMLRQMEAA